MNVDRAFGIAVALLSLAFLVFAVPSIHWVDEGAHYFTVGPRFFPYLAGSASLVLGVLIALRPGSRNAIRELGSPQARRNVAAAVAISVAYVAALEPVGFLLSSVLALLAFFLAFGVRRWITLGAIALGVPLVTEIVFVKLFLLELPAGILSVAW